MKLVNPTTSDSDERPSAHGEESRRADAAWDALPADSEVAVDYPAVMSTLQDPEPTLSVSIWINHPNGRTFNIDSSIPAEGDISQGALLSHLEFVVTSARAALAAVDL